jgi:hypothetical protein
MRRMNVLRCICYTTLFTTEVLMRVLTGKGLAGSPVGFGTTLRLLPIVLLVSLPFHYVLWELDRRDAAEAEMERTRKKK